MKDRRRAFSILSLWKVIKGSQSNDFSISGERFINLSQTIFRSPQNEMKLG